MEEKIYEQIVEEIFIDTEVIVNYIELLKKKVEKKLIDIELRGILLNIADIIRIPTEKKQESEGERVDLLDAIDTLICGKIAMENKLIMDSIEESKKKYNSMVR